MRRWPNGPIRFTTCYNPLSIRNRTERTRYCRRAPRTDNELRQSALKLVLINTHLEDKSWERMKNPDINIVGESPKM